MESEPERTKAHTVVAVPASTMLLTKCIFVQALVCLCGSRDGGRRGVVEGWLLDSRLFDSHPLMQTR